MGLISYIRNLYYDNRLKKADRLLDEGRASEAESYYSYLVDKQPLAACRLAEYYKSLLPSKNLRNDISLFKKAVDLKIQGVGVYDAGAYDAIMLRFAELIADRAKKCFASGKYEDCYTLTSTLKEAKYTSKATNILCSEAKIHLLYKDINSTKATDNKFSILIDTFKKEWQICKESKRTKESILDYCQELVNNRRYYVSNILLCTILNNSNDTKCIDNATFIIQGKDSEANSDIIKAIASTYAKSVVLRDGTPKDEAVKLFELCWKATKKVALAVDILQSAKDIGLRNFLVSAIIQNHKAFFTEKAFFEKFTKWLYDSFTDEESLKLLEQVHSLGYDVEELFAQKTHDIIEKFPLDKRLSYLDHAQNLYPNNKLIINDKLVCAEKFIEQNDNNQAIKVTDSIIGKCEKAKLVKAKALYNIATDEQSVDSKVDLLKQSKAVLGTYNGPHSITIADDINDEFVKAAEQYYKEGEKEEAYSILKNTAKVGFTKALAAIIHYRLVEVQETKTSEERQKAASCAIDEVKEFGSPTLLDNTDYQSLWDEKISALLDSGKNLDNSAAVAAFENLIKEIDSIGFKGELLKSKKEPVLKQLIGRKYIIARDMELADNLSAASDLYKQINALEAKRTPTLSAIRFIICKLKMQNNNDILEHRERIYTILRKAATSYKSEKDDIAYRFALILLKSGEDQEAKSVLEEFLPGEDYLKKACEQGAIIKALAKIEDFNQKLESVKNKSLSSKDAVFFINHMLEYAEIIKPVLDLPRTVLSKYRNKLKNYAIFKLFDEEQYGVAFEKMLKEHKDYLDDYTALRNIALVCLNMAEAGQITTDNYKDVISIWLTAIYQEKVFVKSLDYTSWDDQYTFSLYEAYGHFDEDSVGTLPDNVNFDSSDDENIVYIKDVQRALLDRFEAAISESQQYHEFFTTQKDAMDSFIALNLDDKCRLVAPYLAHRDEDLFQDISDALEEDRKEEYDNWEDLLAVGAIYQMPQTIYNDYSKAKNYYETCIAAIDSVNTSDAKQAFLSSKIELIKRFLKLKTALKSYCNSKISALSAKDKSDFKNNYGFYLIVCNAIKDETLSFVFSNYVMQYVVGEVNSQSMRMAEAADIILSIYFLDKNNSKVKENLTTLFEMLVRDTSLDSSRAVSNILDRLRPSDPSLYNQLNKEHEQAKIDKELNDIVDKVNSHSLSNSSALDKVYSLYKGNPNNDRICANLAQLCTMCIMEYVVGQKSGSSSVERILNALINNMSPAFVSNSIVFKKAYDSIWNQLPFETRTLLKGGIGAIAMNQSLNDKGLALKKGLGYMKSLGGFSSNSSSIFGRNSSIFDDDLYI